MGPLFQQMLEDLIMPHRDGDTRTRLLARLGLGVVLAVVGVAIFG